MGRLTTAIFVCLLVAAAASAQTRIEKNVVYGMYSGLALLMDIHRPETTPNGLGIIYVSGSGWQAPPLAHVVASSPPALLLHGDADTEVPFEQALAMEAALRAVNVPTKLIRVSGGGHGANFPIEGKPHPALPNALDEMVRWLNQYLKSAIG